MTGTSSTVASRSTTVELPADKLASIITPTLPATLLAAAVTWAAAAALLAACRM